MRAYLQAGCPSGPVIISVKADEKVTFITLSSNTKKALRVANTAHWL